MLLFAESIETDFGGQHTRSIRPRALNQEANCFRRVGPTRSANLIATVVSFFCPRFIVFIVIPLAAMFA